ncbi:uncharacterized protein [Palaemon carinicauda]|uniref:uncharacterized protein n=1 Tax=Palaemon carinicauda TaxID=392227 RepID=UPI0035B6066A
MGTITIALALCIAIQLALGFVIQPPLIRTPSLDPETMCSTIKFVDSKRKSTVRESVLRHLCQVGVSHVDLDGIRKQFAIFNLHRDGFESAPRWYSGDAPDVVNNKYWAVNDVEQLDTSKHHWYTHGLPMWPLPYQDLANASTPKILSIPKKKPIDWPNYGMATPIYYAAKAWRNQAWSLEEFFQQMKKKSPFKSHKDYHKLAKSLVETIDSQQVENYSEWPFFKYSLKSMAQSMVRRNKGLCPDELYIYFRMTPCHPKEAQHLSCTQAALAARTILTEINCRATDVIVGYTEEYNNNALRK